MQYLSFKSSLTSIGAMVLAVGVSLLLHSDLEYLQSDELEIFHKLGRVESPLVVESSGVAVSALDPKVLWTINDSGHSNTLFAIGMDGKTKAEIELLNSKNLDWESLASATIDSVPYLVVADVGDNGFKRPSCQLYFVPEPDLSKEVVSCSAVSLEIKYESGSLNCEAISVNPENNDVWLIEKIYYDKVTDQSPGIFKFALPDLKTLGAQPPEDRQPVVAKRIGDFDARNITGMSFSPNGNRLIVRTYTNAFLYEREQAKTWDETIAESKPVPVPLPLQRQGEAICFASDSQSLIVTSEYKRQVIWRVDLDAFLTHRAAQTKIDEPSASSKAEPSSKSESPIK